MKIVIIDNQDSFTHNLSGLVCKIIKKKPSIISSQNINIGEISNFNKIIFSPGPDLPKKNDSMWQIIDRYKNEKSILGICLGMQAIAMYFGGELVNLGNVQHGQICKVLVGDKKDELFSNTGNEFRAGLYHSWAVASSTLPSELIPTSHSEENIIMSISHTNFDIKGLQFHPESFMTPAGEEILKSWIFS